jgi:hypothetical protein
MMDEQTYTIMAAEHGGYIVTMTHYQTGMARTVQFAGSLNDCLEFIRTRFVNALIDGK